ncbi:serine protease [Pilimelia terevasa]|uniref:Serine protease n=1 Tax=Pilimelia terevasa TaxID=53372 RepID=A0A8J3BVF9_9ACTN|nr:trypsin-like peptidase domain-containing protein [Pilimelia terevasa]GGK35655.1 serine protease [Pilimelia terevasa]
MTRIRTARRRRLAAALAAGLLAASLPAAASASPAAVLPAAPDAAAPPAAGPPPGVEDYAGIVNLWGCSGSLVRFRQSLDTDRALVLTNGHCWEKGFPTADQVIYREPSTRTALVLQPDGKDLGTGFKADQIAYGTMLDTDALVYRLAATYADVRARTGIAPLTLADRPPTPPVKVVVNSGAKKKIYRCTYDKQIHRLREGSWVWKDALRYPDCKVVPGTSGSPVIDVATGLVVGVNNTTPMGGGDCQFNNPCEVDEAGKVTVTRDAGYGTQTYLFTECLNDRREIDLAVPTCRLPGPKR